MCKNSIITLLIIILILEEVHVFTMDTSKSVYVCFSDSGSKIGWCDSTIMLCNEGFAYNISINVTVLKNLQVDLCTSKCSSDLHKPPLTADNLTNLAEICSNKKCNMTDFQIPTDSQGSNINAGLVNVTYRCTNDTDATTTSVKSTTASLSSVNATEPTTEITTHFTVSGNKYTAVIVVSVVIPITIAVVVASFMLYRRDKCELRFVKCLNMHDKHTDTADAYAMSSRANVNLTNDLSRGVDVNGCDVDYCEIDKVGKETDAEYSHVNLEKKQVIQDPTYNHIGHLKSSFGNAEQTYNHVGDATLRITKSSTLQMDTYSHIGAMAKPASEQLADNSYEHINGVMKYIPEANDINQYDCTIFETNGGQTGGFGHQESEVKSGKEKKFHVVGPSKVDVNNEAPVSHSYFILEKREKDA